MEKRREKSRDAARCRRSRETEIFADLGSMLPLSTGVVSHLDKASIVRIAISYLKIRTVVYDFVSECANRVKADSGENKSDSSIFQRDPFFINALEGFLLLVSSEGDITFISENVNKYLGLSQVELLGQSIYEFSHPCDHAEIKEMLSMKDLPANQQKTFFLRMKCTLTNKGRNVNIKSASYKVIQYTGHLMETNDNCSGAGILSVNKEIKQELLDNSYGDVDDDDNDSNSGSGGSNSNHSVQEEDMDMEDNKEKGKSSTQSACYFIAIGEPISHPADIEIPLGQNTFLSKHSLDMKFTYADDRIRNFFGYDTDSLIKKSVFDYHHTEDISIIKKSFKNLFQKGQSQTEKYRFLALGGGYAWVLTQSTLIYNNKGQKPSSVVCVNFIISGIENKDEIYSLCQIAEPCKKTNIPIGSLSAEIEAIQPPEVVAVIPTVENVNSFSSASSSFSQSSCKRGPDDKLRLVARSPLKSINQKTNKQLRQRLRKSLTDKLFNLSVDPKASATEKRISRIFDQQATNTTAITTDNTAIATSTAAIANSATTNSTIPKSILSPPFEQISNAIDVNNLELHNQLISNDNSSDSGFSDGQPESPGNLENICCRKFTTSGIFKNRADILQVARSQKGEIENEEVDGPKPATSDVFVPLTGDMNKGFLTFIDEDDSMTMLKEDPDDLTHLAPTAGDVCVPLDSDDECNPSTYILPEMLNDIMLSDCNLLSGCRTSITDDRDLSLSSSSPGSFFSYQNELEESLSRPISPLLTQSGDDCSLPSMASINGNESDYMRDSFLDFGLVDADDKNDLSMKPFLPIESLDQDTLLPFVTNDLMWGSGSSTDSSNWSSLSSSPRSNCSSSPHLENSSTSSSLSKLLQTDQYLDAQINNKTKNSIVGNTLNNTSYYSARKNANSSNQRDCNDDNNGKVTPGTINHFLLKRKHPTVGKKGISMASNLKVEEKKKAYSVPVSCKRTLSENWNNGRYGGTGNNWKRRKNRQTVIQNPINSSVNSAERGDGVQSGDGAYSLGRMMAGVDGGKMFNQTNSVLMNLLVSGCDLNAGYEDDCNNDIDVDDKNSDKSSNKLNTILFPSVPVCDEDDLRRVILRTKSASLLDPESTRIPSLMDLTEQDYAVNAPSNGKLLQGSDLLKALEFGTIF